VVVENPRPLRSGSFPPRADLPVARQAPMLHAPLPRQLRARWERGACEALSPSLRPGSGRKEKAGRVDKEPAVPQAGPPVAESFPAASAGDSGEDRGVARSSRVTQAVNNATCRLETGSIAVRTRTCPSRESSVAAPRDRRVGRVRVGPAGGRRTGRGWTLNAWFAVWSPCRVCPPQSPAKAGPGTYSIL